MIFSGWPLHRRITESETFSPRQFHLVRKRCFIIGRAVGIREGEEDSEIHICTLSHSVIEISEYRSNFAEYLKSKMAALPPNLIVLVERHLLVLEIYSIS